VKANAATKDVVLLFHRLLKPFEQGWFKAFPKANAALNMD